MSSDLIGLFKRELEQHGHTADAAQLVFVAALQRLAEDLAGRRRTESSLINRLGRGIGLLGRKPVQGVYAWGGVGRGKTFVMDFFFQHAPVERRQRVHFHRFMLSVHQQLHQLKSRENPLDEVARSIAGEAELLCFDELHVDDITDAMVLAGLFGALLQNGVALVFTSNCDVEDLYRDGLQRERFRPAIQLLKQHCEILNIDGGVDYRLRTLAAADSYVCPHGPDTDAELAALFNQLVGDLAANTAPLTVLGREIPLLMECEGVCWFSFAQLCEGFRSKADYVELSRFFHTIIISDIPLLGVDGNDPARRFIELVDELYDRQVNVIVSAAEWPDALYQGERLKSSFLRTASRLQEFADPAYMAKPHRP